MNRRERLAALKIAALLEEFSPRELGRAADALSGNTPLPAPLDELLRGAGGRAAGGAPRGQPDRLRESRAVQALKERDPDRHRLLAEFEVLLRRNEVLPRTRDLSDFARDLDIDVGQRARRQDVISKLMARLVELPIESAREVITSVPDSDAPGDGYHRLATYIYKGYDPGPTSTSESPGHGGQSAD